MDEPSVHTAESPAPHASRADADVDKREKQKELAKQRDVDKREKLKELAKLRAFATHAQKQFMENGRIATNLVSGLLKEAKHTQWQEETSSTRDYFHALDFRVGETQDLGYAPKDPNDSTAKELDLSMRKWSEASKALENHIEDLRRAKAAFREIVNRVGRTRVQYECKV